MASPALYILYPLCIAVVPGRSAGTIKPDAKANKTDIIIPKNEIDAPKSSKLNADVYLNIKSLTKGANAVAKSEI